MAEEKKIETRTPERIARDSQAKALGAICNIVLECEDGEKILYFRKPHRKILGVFYKTQETDEIEAAYNLFRATLVREVSNMEVMDEANDLLFYSAYLQRAILLSFLELKKSTSSIL